MMKYINVSLSMILNSVQKMISENHGTRKKEAALQERIEKLKSKQEKGLSKSSETNATNELEKTFLYHQTQMKRTQVPRITCQTIRQSLKAQKLRKKIRKTINFQLLIITLPNLTL